MNKNDLLRFQKYIELDLLEGCWLWKSNINENGYGYFKINYKNMRAHRVSYQYWNGPISKNYEIDHLCRNRSCVNPQHLEAVTHQENTKRGLQSKPHLNQHVNKTHCKRGHEFNEKNTYVKDSSRHCRICHKERCRKYTKIHAGTLKL